ncbi:hypothetical protein [Solemya velesiana gill symbiont]|uniref:Chromosome partition protein Smc n=1 Tax=Solemya velesiana gill symbiont TaxID=1918948 RepID=A0A1T2KSM7_9GAMM|nr:hypothetical protein [Solemya velesiana gill symbiont]OOZ35832.1 hypothetical protein BOW51_10150 [Solemya velesiana gill symbiont]
MLPNSSFTDLRLNRQEGQNQESFWPSFTDIMTVIVMIFMIAMVVLLLRNIELMNQLRATMEAERSAMELARTTGEEKESLALKLIDAENRLSMLKIRVMRLKEQSQQQETTIGTQGVEISKLMAEKEDLALRRDQLVAENFTLGEKLKRSETQMNTLQQNYDTLQQNYNTTQQQLTDSQQLLAETQATLSGMKSQVQAIQQQLASLQDRYTVQSEELQLAKASGRQAVIELSSLRGEYRELKIKYDKLVRPARSPEGRYLVDVRYSKVGDAFVIDVKSQDDKEFKRVSQQVLEQKLSQLKAVKSDGLYIKVIFPEDSGLSFNEAWSFTNNLHNRYDYYYQEDAPGLIPMPAEISE